jgi:hypothetical protein
LGSGVVNARPGNAGHDTRRIQDWLGHRSIQHTTGYTVLYKAARTGGFGPLAVTPYGRVVQYIVSEIGRAYRATGTGMKG